MASFVSFKVQGETIESILAQCNLNKNFFKELTTGFEAPFGDTEEFGCDPLIDFNFSNDVVDVLCRILDRLLDNISCRLYNTHDYMDKVENIERLRDLLQKHHQDINKLVNVTLEKGYCFGSDGAGYELLSVNQGRGNYIHAESDNRYVFNWTLMAEALWWDELHEDYSKTEAFKEYEETRIPDDFYDSAVDQYWDELVEGEHPEYFRNHVLSSATKLQQFVVECPAAKEIHDHEIIGKYDLPLLSEWARYCGSIEEINYLN